MRTRWLFFAIIATSAFWWNFAWLLCAAMNDWDVSNWFNLRGFLWFFGGSATVLSILAVAFKVL